MRTVSSSAGCFRPQILGRTGRIAPLPTAPCPCPLSPVPSGGERPRWDQCMARTNDTERPMADGRERNPSPNFLVMPPQPRVGPLRWHIVAQTRPIYDKRRTMADRGHAEHCAASLQFRNSTRGIGASSCSALGSLPSALCPLPRSSAPTAHSSLTRSLVHSLALLRPSG